MPLVQIEGLRKAEYGDASPEYECPQNNSVQPLSMRILCCIISSSWTTRSVDTEVPWYIAQPGDKLTKEAKIFFQDYTVITDDGQSVEHLCSVRDRAWKLPYSQYSYLGRWWFLRSIFATTPYYESVLEATKVGASIVDVGCGLGHELRHLRSAGTKGEMYAIDMQQEMWDLGLELFADSDTPHATFVKAEMVRDVDGVLKTAFPQKPDLVLLCRFFDLHWSVGQFALQNIMAHCTKVGTRIVGYTLGTDYESSGDVMNRGDRGGHFLPCEHFLRAIWENAFHTTETSWDLDTLGFEPGDSSWMKTPPKNAVCFYATQTA